MGHLVDEEERHIETDLIPFARDHGGNFFCISVSDGSICFFAMDMGDDFVRARKELAPSFDQFIEGLVEDREEDYL